VKPQADTLWLMNGVKLPVKYIGNDSQYVYFEIAGKRKKKVSKADRENVFSVIFASGREEFYFTSDVRNPVSPHDYKAYLIGYRDGYERYFPYGYVALGVIYNMAGGFVLARNPLVLAVPWTYVLLVWMLPVSPHYGMWREPTPQPTDLYMEGFKMGIKNKKVNVVIGVSLGSALAGVILGNYIRAGFNW